MSGFRISLHVLWSPTNSRMSDTSWMNKIYKWICQISIKRNANRNSWIPFEKSSWHDADCMILVHAVLAWCWLRDSGPHSVCCTGEDPLGKMRCWPWSPLSHCIHVFSKTRCLLKKFRLLTPVTDTSVAIWGKVSEWDTDPQKPFLWMLLCIFPLQSVSRASCQGLVLEIQIGSMNSFLILRPYTYLNSLHIYVYTHTLFLFIW